MFLPTFRNLSCLLGLSFSLLCVSTQSLAQVNNSGQSNHFVVSPVKVFLNSAVPSPNTFLTIRNTSNVTKRFQVRVFKWSQTDTNPSELTPTEEVILFPLLLTVEAGQSRNLRLGIDAPPTPIEKTYRVFIEELPGAQTQENKGTAINVRLQMNIPVFFQPQKPQSQPEITNLVNNKGKFSFQLTNTGNAHYIAQEIQVSGTDASGQAIFQKSRAGWYVLSGSTQSYDLELPKPDCQKVTTLTVSVKTDTNSKVTQTLSTPQGVCP